MTDHQNCRAWNCRTWKWHTKNDARARAWNGMLNLYSVYSASNVRRLCALLCPAVSFLRFHVLQFHVLLFHALQIGPSISRPSFSRPAFSAPPMCVQNLKFVALPVSEIIAIEVLGVANPQCWGRAGRRGSALVPYERALVSFYRPSIVTFPLSLRVSDILPLLCSSTPLFPTLPLVSPKFPYVPLGVGIWPLG